MVAEGTRRSGTGPELARISEQIQQEYVGRTSASATAFDRARKSMPGGDTRTVAFHPPYPLTIVKGEGYTLTDLDGNTYIDVLNNYTSLIHGHAFAPITEAVTAQLQFGTNYAAALEAQAELAERLTSRVKSVDKVRFTNSGTEANLLAIAAARLVTGRQAVMVMEGGYHGGVLYFGQHKSEIGIFDAQDKGAVRFFGNEVGVKRGAQIADVHIAGWAWGKTCSEHSHFLWFVSCHSPMNPTIKPGVLGFNTVCLWTQTER